VLIKLLTKLKSLAATYNSKQVYSPLPYTVDVYGVIGMDLFKLAHSVKERFSAHVYGLEIKRSASEIYSEASSRRTLLSSLSINREATATSDHTIQCPQQ